MLRRATKETGSEQHMNNTWPNRPSVTEFREDFMEDGTTGRLMKPAEPITSWPLPGPLTFTKKPLFLGKLRPSWCRERPTEPLSSNEL